MTISTRSLARFSTRGLWLLTMRISWMLMVVLVSVVVAAAVPLRMAQLAELALQERGALSELRLPVNFYIFYLLALDVVTLSAFWLTAAIIFLRRSNEWMTLLLSMALLMFAAAISPFMDALSAMRPAWVPLVDLVRGLGIIISLLFLYLFPDGQFVPRWTRILVIVWLLWLLAWRFLSAPVLDYYNLSTPMRFFANMLVKDPQSIGRVYNYIHLTTLLLILVSWFATGVFAQIHRFKKVSNPLQRQQTKWIVLGMTAAFIGYCAYNLPLRLLPAISSSGQLHLLYILIGEPIYLISLLLIPVFIGISISLYRLWDIDLLIYRTLVYGAVTGLLALIYFGSVLLIQQISLIFTGIDAPSVVIAVSTLIIASLFQPARTRIQDFIDRAFYREQVDFRKAFMEFSRQVRTIIDMNDLLHILVERTTNLLHISHAAVFLRDDQQVFQKEHTYNMEGVDARLALDFDILHRLQTGLPVSMSRDPAFQMLVPLLAPKQVNKSESSADKLESRGGELIGVLALGPRLSGQAYTREDQVLLTGLADQAGTAIYVAGLIEDRQAETRLREQAEKQLQEFRASPQGRAEALAQSLVAAPEQALARMYQLMQLAGKDPDSSILLSNLPNALVQLNASQLSALAEGFSYLYSSQFTSELLPAGLHSIIGILSLEEEQAVGAGKPYPLRRALLHIYQVCQSALEANSITQITEMLDKLSMDDICCEDLGVMEEELNDLSRTFIQLNSVAKTLRAYERVDTSQDKLAYLASAIERLRHVNWFARNELLSGDRSLVERITESWMAVVASTMSDLQTRAHLLCQLLTRHTWQDDTISLALSVRNEGRGAAVNIRVSLAPTAEYTVMEESAHLERLAPGEESQVQLRVRPRLEKGVDNFRVRFIILYTDPRGADQVENFADVVYLLGAEGEFQFIPNPYVVGTPLQPGSPLFFGRADIMQFIQDNLAATHRNNLVLIGQRRTGKTSLLKQLPTKLGDDYLVVYLDGQALGLDPGLPNFFLALATEIAFAIEDRGFEIQPPELADYQNSPASAFEHNFLNKVRAAIGQRHLLVMLDEFEELESAVRRGDLEPSIFSFLRHIIQHAAGLSVIFCGTHRLEELAADYWNVLFNISLYRHISFLDRDEAMRLIQEPVKSCGLMYDDLALDKMWRVTAGHPYFLQLLCHSLVNYHNKTRRSYITVADLNVALDEILASGEAHFVYLWAESNPVERLALTVLSRMVPLSGQATAVQVVDYLEERGITTDRQAMNEALHHLALRSILEESSPSDAATVEVYHWKMGLLGLWVEKYRSLNRVVDEL